MKIIGLAGPAGSGKDTVCGYALEWCKEQGIYGERFAFADSLKRSAAACFGIPASEALDFCNRMKQPGVQVVVNSLEFDPEEPPLVDTYATVSGREFLQHYGTEAHRDVFEPEFWVTALNGKLSTAADEGVEACFITDTRFPNEAEYVYRNHGEIWHISRPGGHKVEAHASEQGLDFAEGDLGIPNLGSLPDLRGFVRSACEVRIGGNK